MQITIQCIPCSYTEFEYYTGSSDNSIVYSLIQHLPEIFGDIASINNSSSLHSSSFPTSAATMPPIYLILWATFIILLFILSIGLLYLQPFIISFFYSLRRINYGLLVDKLKACTQFQIIK
jgi:hypothetical protein